MMTALFALRNYLRESTLELGGGSKVDEWADEVALPAYNAFAAMMSTMQLLLAHISSATGLSPSVLVAFEAIEDGADRVSDVAEATNASPSAASRTVDQLVEAGIVAREPDHDDRRVHRLRLTEEGRALSKDVAAQVVPLIRGAVEEVGRDRVEAAAAVTSEMARRIAEALRS